MAGETGSREKDPLAALLREVREYSLLRGHRLYLFEFLCAHGRASLRDIQRHMSTRGCILGDVLSDLAAWGVITEDGRTMAPESGSLVPIYRPTGRLPSVEGVVPYKDIF